MHICLGTLTELILIDVIFWEIWFCPRKKKKPQPTRNGKRDTNKFPVRTLKILFLKKEKNMYLCRENIKSVDEKSLFIIAISQDSLMSILEYFDPHVFNSQNTWLIKAKEENLQNLKLSFNSQCFTFQEEEKESDYKRSLQHRTVQTNHKRCWKVCIFMHWTKH